MMKMTRKFSKCAWKNQRQALSKRASHIISTWGTCLLLCFWPVAALQAQTTPAYQVKAAFLYNFSQPGKGSHFYVYLPVPQ
jgi:hypothetical protein